VCIVFKAARLFLLFLFLFCFSFPAFSSDDVYVAVSPGIAPCVEDIYSLFAGAGGGPIVFVKEATGPLAQKMDAGAPFDLLVAADPEWPAWLAERGKLAGLQKCADGHLVLWAENKESCSEEKLPDLRIAAPDPETTSHGILAAGYLTSAGLWEEGLASKKILISRNALHAVLAVQAGSADAALIPESLAIGTKGAYIRLAVPPISTVAGLNTAGASETAGAFFRFLLSPEAAGVWKKWGFEPAGAPK
jgi:molybdate transport system substrate-binding protein